VSGFRLNDPFALGFLKPSYSTPTLHILGKTDAVVIEERSRQLIEVSENSRIEEHNGGDSHHSAFDVGLYADYDCLG
jgi:hypothetical protein